MNRHQTYQPRTDVVTRGPGRRSAALRAAVALAVAAALSPARDASAETATVPGSNTTALRPAGQAVPTVSLSGSTALRSFLINNGDTYLTSGTAITLGDGSANQGEINYAAPVGNGVTYQLSPSNYSTPDTTTGNTQSHSALTLEYHEAGSAEGTLELVDSQIGTFFTDKTEYNPNSTQAVYINRNKFGGTSPTGPIPTAASPTVSLNGFTLGYQSATGARNAQSQNRVQIAVSDNAPVQSFSVAGTPSPFTAAGTAGYGLGNPALAFVGGPETHLAQGRYQLVDQSAANMAAGATNPAYDPAQPRSGPQTYGAGPWNTAGVNNLNSTVVAQTATLFAANPGTGMVHLNRTDAQWLLTTGRLQNGAAFQVTTRDQGSGTRSVSALNVGVDPSYAVGVNDRGDGNAADGGTTQINIGSIAVTGPGARSGVTYTIPGITYSNKTAGGAGLRPTVQVSRMAVGTLSLSDFMSNANGQGSSKPLRALSYRDDANDVSDNSNGSGFKNFSEDASGNSTFTTGDLPSNTFIAPSARSITNGSYVLYQNEQFVTVKSPNSVALYNNAAVIKGDNGVTLNADGSGAGHDAADYVHNITSAVANQPLPTSTSLANPADTLLAIGYIVPQLMLVQKSADGLNASSVNPGYNSNYRNNVFLPNVSPAVFNPADPSTVTSGSSSTYGNVAPPGGQGAIKLTDTDPANHTSGNYLFGNFNQNGVRDLSSLKAAQTAQATLFASGLGTDMFAGAANSNSAKVPGLASPLATMTGQDGTAGATKGDLIAMGDIEGSGQFTGRSLYYMATGTAMSDASGAGFTNGQLTTASGPTLGDQVRNGVLRKNAGLDFLQTNATAQQKIDARAVVFDSTGTQVLADNDPTGANAFNKLDVNRDGAVNRQDAQVIDSQLGKNFSNINDQLNSVLRTDINPAGTAFVAPTTGALLDPTSAANASIPRRSYSIVNSVLFDGKTGVDRTDFDLLRGALGAGLTTGDANFDGMVNFTDLSILLQNYGAATPRWGLGNFENDPTVDFKDLSDLLQNYNAGTGSSMIGFDALRADPAAMALLASDGIGSIGGIDGNAIPEPTSLGLAGASGLLLLRRRRPGR